MSQNLHIRNVPDEVMERLREAASRHRRSVNAEVISALEMQLYGYASEHQREIVESMRRRMADNPPSDPEVTRAMIREDRER